MAIPVDNDEAADVLTLHDPAVIARRVLDTRLPADLPVTGAWQPGDPPGRRQFLYLPSDRGFALEFGGVLHGAQLAYETWGELNDAADNAVLVCHALTGDAHAAGLAAHGHGAEGWWDDFIGPGQAVDTDRYFVVCVNVLGGCQGSTGPASVDATSGRPYGSAFPVVSVRDVVRSQRRVADHLGIDRWHSVVGGSMGGMQALEWAIMYPDRVRTVVALATTAAASPQQVAWSAVGRLAIVLDPRWRGGDYYHADPGDGPAAGLAVARQIAQITYRTDEVFQERFGRSTIDRIGDFGLWGRFDVESYLDHHGQKLVRRFDANSYLLLNRLMDLHDVARGRGGVRHALARVTAPVLVASISSDALYPPRQQRELVQALEAVGVRHEYHVVDSPQGHDGFLLEHAELGPIITDFLGKEPS
ncbi:MAG: homoserine O-acetyltransferase [Acidimicrobiia bacterium]|nr:homoserine O-acetyltransferase [Acidimicrobiia bacterium]MDH5238793.1 homoserine O-acetyltransferase [Acidimicrobiia bacterium]